VQLRPATANNFENLSQKPLENIMQSTLVQLNPEQPETDAGGSPSAGVDPLFVSAAVASGGGALPMDSQRWQIALSAAAQLEKGGGGIPDTDRSSCIARRAVATYQACGDGWNANLAQFVNATEMGQFGNRLPN
jgi:hypothetical protein